MTQQQATVTRVYFTHAEPARRAVCRFKPGKDPFATAIPDDVEEGDRILVGRDRDDSYRFVRKL